MVPAQRNVAHCAQSRWRWRLRQTQVGRLGDAGANRRCQLYLPKRVSLGPRVNSGIPTV